MSEVKSQAPAIVVRVTTKSTTMGNPRRMGIIHQQNEQGRWEEVAHVTEGRYKGEQSWRGAYPNYQMIQSIHVAPSEWNAIKRAAKEAGTLIEN